MTTVSNEICDLDTLSWQQAPKASIHSKRRQAPRKSGVAGSHRYRAAAAAKHRVTVIEHTNTV